MAVNAADGTRHHSAGRAAFHDRMAADSKNKSMAAAPNKTATMDKGDHPGHVDGHEDAKQDVSHLPITEVVEEHGPAHHIAIHHDHEANVHHIESHHGDKENPHVHHSEHESAEKAHHHAKMAAGLEHTPEEEHETPDDANRALGDDESEENEKGIPGLS